jgi:hypothetical protein
MKPRCREPLARPWRRTQPGLLDLLPHFRIINDPKTLARLHAEVVKLKRREEAELQKRD